MKRWSSSTRLEVVDDDSTESSESRSDPWASVEATSLPRLKLLVLLRLPSLGRPLLLLGSCCCFLLPDCLLRRLLSEISSFGQRWQ